MYILVSIWLLLLCEIRVEHSSRKLPRRENSVFIILFIMIGFIFVKNRDTHTEIVIVIMIWNGIKMNSAESK